VAYTGANRAGFESQKYQNKANLIQQGISTTATIGSNIYNDIKSQKDQEAIQTNTLALNGYLSNGLNTIKGEYDTSEWGKKYDELVKTTFSTLASNESIVDAKGNEILSGKMNSVIKSGVRSKMEQIYFNNKEILGNQAFEEDSNRLTIGMQTDLDNSIKSDNVFVYAKESGIIPPSAINAEQNKTSPDDEALPSGFLSNATKGQSFDFSMPSQNGNATDADYSKYPTLNALAQKKETEVAKTGETSVTQFEAKMAYIKDRVALRYPGNPKKQQAVIETERQKLIQIQPEQDLEIAFASAFHGKDFKDWDYDGFIKGYGESLKTDTYGGKTLMVSRQMELEQNAAKLYASYLSTYSVQQEDIYRKQIQPSLEKIVREGQPISIEQYDKILGNGGADPYFFPEQDARYRTYIYENEQMEIADQYVKLKVSENSEPFVQEEPIAQQEEPDSAILHVNEAIPTDGAANIAEKPTGNESVLASLEASMNPETKKKADKAIETYKGKSSIVFADEDNLFEITRIKGMVQSGDYTSDEIASELEMSKKNLTADTFKELGSSTYQEAFRSKPYKDARDSFETKASKALGDGYWEIHKTDIMSDFARESTVLGADPNAVAGKILLQYKDEAYYKSYKKLTNVLNPSDTVDYKNLFGFGNEMQDFTSDANNGVYDAFIGSAVSEYFSSFESILNQADFSEDQIKASMVGYFLGIDYDKSAGYEQRVMKAYEAATDATKNLVAEQTKYSYAMQAAGKNYTNELSNIFGARKNYAMTPYGPGVLSEANAISVPYVDNRGNRTWMVFGTKKENGKLVADTGKSFSISTSSSQILNLENSLEQKSKNFLASQGQYYKGLTRGGLENMFASPESLPFLHDIKKQESLYNATVNSINKQLFVFAGGEDKDFIPENYRIIFNIRRYTETGNLKDILSIRKSGDTR
jgi:hypothetical protein